MNNELESLSFPLEKWRPIENFEGLYSVSNMGRVYSHRSKKVLRPRKRAKGYLFVSLCKDAKVKQAFVHRLVLKAFKPTSDSNLQVNHKDGDKENNSLENLDWVTGSENIRHSIYVLGNDYGSKAVVQFTRDGIRLNVFRSIDDAERATGVYQSNICQCAKGHLKQAGGYVWKYLSDLTEEEAA